jgi:glycosyltransferase involved in cell wall biosynthesis
MTVEYSIGYISSFAKYRVYESHCWRAWSAGTQGQTDGRFFDEVIPLFFDEDEFEFQKEKEPFALYVGRLIPKKGVAIACQVAQAAGIPLKVIGHGDPSLVTHGAEYLGALGAVERNTWMSRASALLCPTIYVEPFGSVAVEAQLCGTPAISTNFGGFVETVEHGKTGFRCSYLGEFVQALKDAPTLDPIYIRQRAIAKYSMHNVKHDYQRYFDRLALLWGKGWDTV